LLLIFVFYLIFGDMGPAMPTTASALKGARGHCPPPPHGPSPPHPLATSH
jgi:hypothetical protein